MSEIPSEFVITEPWVFSGLKNSYYPRSLDSLFLWPRAKKGPRKEFAMKVGPIPTSANAKLPSGLLWPPPRWGREGKLYISVAREDPGV